MTRLKLSIVALLLCYADVGFCINTGSNLLSTARQYDERGYANGQPPNLNHTGDKKDDFYLYHEYWGSSSWNGIDAWTGSFDCSGLVSYAANLRRHYSSSELKMVLGSSKTWENASVGDVISFEDTNHDAIFVSRQYNLAKGTDTVNVFHATEYTNADGVLISKVLEEDYREYKYFSVDHTAHPHEFISDSTIPEISAKILGDGSTLQDGGVYHYPIKIDFGATDNINISDEKPFIKANYPDTTNFNKDGVYQLHIITKDWANNINDKIFTFTIDSLAVSLDKSSLYGTVSGTGLDRRVNYARFTVNINSPAGLKYLELWSDQGRISQESGNNAKTLSKQFEVSSGGQYKVVVKDAASNVKELQIDLAAVEGEASNACATLQCQSGVYDLWKSMGLSASQISAGGGVMPGAEIYQAAPVMNYGYTVVAGAFTEAALHQMGSVDASVETSDSEDMAGASAGTFNQTNYYETDTGETSEISCPSDPDTAFLRETGCARGSLGCIGPHYSRCGVGNRVVNVPVKRYARFTQQATQGASSGFPMGMCPPLKYNLNSKKCDNEPLATLAFSVSGSDLNVRARGVCYSTSSSDTSNVVSAGTNISVIAAAGLELVYDLVDQGGYATAGRIYEPAPDGYILLTGYDIANTALFAGQVALKFEYDAAGITSDQIAAAQIYRLVTTTSGTLFEKVTTVVDAALQIISGRIDHFSSYIVAYPVQTTPYFITSTETISNVPAFTMQTDRFLTTETKAADSVELATAVSTIRANGLMPVSTVYAVSDSTYPYQPYSLVTMAWDADVLSGLGVSNSTLTLYGFNSSGNLTSVTGMTTDASNHTITGKIYSPVAMFAIFASTNAVPVLQPDTTPPVTLLGYTTPVYRVNQSMVYSSSNVSTYLDAADQSPANTLVSGLHASYYTIDTDTTVFQNTLDGQTTQYFQLYTSTLTKVLTEGQHLLAYGSVDNTGNYESLKTESIYIDTTSPITEFGVAGASTTINGILYVVANSSIALSPSDPFSGGVRSGVSATYYLTDKNFMACSNLTQLFTNPSAPLPEFNGTPGTCDNPVYSEPFALLPGTHTIYFFSMDNIWNQETIQSRYFNFNGDTTPPVTTAWINGQAMASGATAYITTFDTVTLTAVDEGSGVKNIYFTTGTIFSTNTAVIYTTPFTFPSGMHTVYYSAMDNAGNIGTIKSLLATVGEKKYANPIDWPYYEFIRKFPAVGYSTIDKDGNILGISSLGVQKYTAEGQFITSFGTGQLYGPESMASCANGDTWIVDYDYTVGKYKFKKFGPDGTLQKNINLSSRSDLGYAILVYVACGKDSYPYVLGFDTPNWTGAIFKFDPSGTFIKRLPVTLPNGTGGLTTDKQGTLYTRNQSVNKAYKYSPEGQLLFEWNTNPGAFGTIAVDDYSNIYLGNSQYHMVEIYGSTGGVIASFGSLPVGYALETLSSPDVRAVHPVTGRVYATDGGMMKMYGYDHTPPAMPIIYNPYDMQTVYTPSPLVFGRAEAGSILRIYNNGILAGTMNANSEGWTNGPGPVLNFGSNSMEFRVSDLAGNMSARTPSVNLTMKYLMSVVFSSAQYGPGNWNIYDASTTVTADFNKDGNADVAIFSFKGIYYEGNYSFYAGKGDGTFEYRYSTTLGLSLSAADDGIAADFNNDGNLDIAISAQNFGDSSNSFSIMLGNGDGTFSAPAPYGFINRYAELTTLDFNNDSAIDIAANSGDNMLLFANNGGGMFTLALSTPYPAGAVTGSGFAAGIKAADLDLDGNSDVISGNTVFFGDSSGTFSENKILPLFGDNNVTEVEIADVNMDGYLDIILCSPYKVISYINLGNRNFIAASVNKARILISADIGDYNRDGAPDVVISPRYIQNMILLLGKGDGTFSDAVNFPTGVGNLGYSLTSIGNINTSDINNDTLPDVVMAPSMAQKADGSYIQSFIYFVNGTPIPDDAPPAIVSLSAVAEESGDVVLNWTAPGDDGTVGKASSYDLRTSLVPITGDADFASANRVNGIPAPKPAGIAEEFRVSGLAAGTTYYFALKTMDEVPNISGISNSPGVFLKFIAKSTHTVDGNPEIVLSAYQQQVYVVPVSTASTAGIIALSTAVEQGLFLTSNLYDMAPEMDYDPPATLVFYYSTANLGDIPEDELFVYEHFPGEGWKKLDGQTRDTVNHRITVPIYKIASLAGVFWKVRDMSAPRTRLLVSGDSWTAGGGTVYISGRSSITLEAYDPVIYSEASGVDLTEFKIDPDTSTPFILYSGPFTLTNGTHTIEFRSRDKAGNIEVAKSSAVFTDGEPPSPGFSIAGSSFAADGTLYVSAGSTVTLVSSDTASGLKALYYNVNGDTYAALSGSAELYLSTGGQYALAYYATDNVNNTASEQHVLLYVDTTPPVTSFDSAGIAGRNEWYLSGVGISLAAIDDRSGIQRTQYSLDGSTFAVYVSSFAVAAEGEHAILAYSVDNIGNIESTKTSTFRIDASTPVAEYALTPAPNAAGWNNSAVDVVFSGTDAISGIAYCSSSFTISGESQSIPLLGYCMDYAGWSSTAAFTVSIDTTAPDSKIVLAGAVGRNSWYTSPVAATLAFTDNLSGVDKKYYSLDGSLFAIYSSSITIAAEGIHSLKYYATDLAGNTEPVKETILRIDLGVPSVLTVSSPVANGYGWNKGVVTVAFNGNDAASGIDYCTSVQIVAMQGSSQTITGYCIDYAGLSSTATLTVSIDTTLPIIQYTQTPTANEYGWINRDVTLKFSCSDDLSGLQECPADIILSTEGINISTSAQTSDYADNSSIIKVDSLNIDKTIPATVADVAGNYHNGWYSSAVNVLLSSTDSLSGVKDTFYSLDGGSSTVYEQPSAVSAEGGHTVAYYSMDKAGNTEEPKALTFSIDKSSPIVSYTLAPQPNASGWNKSAVLAVFTGIDTLSGVVVCSSQTISIEGSGQNINGWCRDVAGNIGYAPATVNIDLTQPAIAALPEPAANSYGWHSSTVTVKFSCSDNISGVATCPADIALFSEGANISTSAVVYDLADNQAEASVSGINIDLGLPTSTAALSGSFRNGYYTTSVVVIITSTDTLSGVEKTVYSLDGGQFTEYKTPLSITGDGRHTVKYYTLDKAGNTESERSVTFTIDATLPSISFVITPQANQSGWHDSTVQVVFKGTDTLSGIDACIAAQNITVEGRGQNILGWCRDIAGNISYATATLNIDLTAPVASAVQMPEPNAAGWNKTPVSAAFSGTDDVSGIAYCSSSVIVSVEGAGQTISGYCMDYAGWSSTATLTLNIDMSAPAISMSSPVAGQTFIATRNKLDIGFIVKDNLDPTPKIGAFLVQIEDRGSPRGDRPKVISVTNGQSIEPLDIDDGVWHLIVSATDFADNLGMADSGVFEVIHDIMPPRSSVSVETLKRYDSGTVIYVRKDTRFELSSTDDLVTLNDGLGLGGGKQTIGIKTEGSTPRELVFNNPMPKPATTFISAFMLDKELDGLYTLSYNAEDVLVNKEKILISIYAVDNTSPNTMAALIGASYQSGNNIYLNKASGLALSAVDVSSNGVASGLKEIRYNLDNGGWVTYTSTLAISGLSEGVHSLVYYSADNLDNTEASKTYAFIADFTAPASAYSIGSPYYIAGGINYITPETPISFDAADSLFGGTASGVSRIEVSIDGSAFIAYNAPLKLSEGRHTITYRAIDNVGNTETEKTVKVQSDNTSPVSAWSISEGQSLEKDNRFYLNANGRIALSSVDPIINNVASGVERINYGIGAAPDTRYTSPVSLTEGIRTVNYSAKDNVGNAEVAKSSIIYVDGTSPDTGLSMSGDQYKGDRQYISQRTDVILTAMDPAVNDVAVGVKETKYAVDSGQFNDYAPFRLAAEGKRVVSFYSADYVGNMETVKNAELWVDTTPPATLLAISGARYDTEGVIYITRDSGVTLTGADLGNAAASGLMFTKYRLDGGAWQVYAGSFTINTEGRHVLAYYSLDHVQNTEDMKISSITVDNTAPISSLILGEPRFTAFGLPVITPDTPIMITAADAGAASGVAGLHYELYDAMSGELKFAGSYFEPLKVSLQGTFILKYWAVDNVGNMEPSKEARFAVTTLQQSGLIAAAGLNMSGTADISGKTASNGVIALSGNTRILGDVAASTITLTGKAQITGQQTTGVTPVAPAPIILSEISRSVRGVNDNALIDAKYLPEGKLTANGKEIITLSTGTYYLKGISLAGGASIVLAGPVAILVEGDININGGSVLNSGGIASGLNIFVSTNSTLSFTGGGSLAAYVYAPYSDLKLTGNAVLGGHYFVKSALLSGTGNIIQSGETLPLVTASLPDGGNGKKGVSAAGGSYSVSAGPDPAFRLGEVYVFPNPAKAGAKPVFHVETGIADNVKVTVYTVSGRVAHERTLAGLPVALDDGNGLDYAYEYTWDGHIPSGVYYYLVEAAKAGQKLKKTGKFVVVR